MVDRRGQKNARFVALVSLAVRFEANTSKFFTNFDCFVVLTDCSGAEMSRSGDFCATDSLVTKPIALPLAHAHGVTTPYLVAINTQRPVVTYL